MTEWDPESVIAAANEWAWIPEGAPHVGTDEYVLIAYPDWFVHRTMVRLRASNRDPLRLVDEVHALVRDWGRDTVTWAVADHTRPPGLEAELRRRGAAVTERADILAMPLAGRPDGLRAPSGVAVREVTDEQGVRDATLVEVDAFGTPTPDEATIAERVAEVEQALAAESGGRFVAYLSGVAVGTGGWTRAGDVARLWGAGTSTQARGRGIYRAVLEARLRRAAGLGCTLALTHGRVETSSPILQRVGFRRYGEQRMLRLPV